MGRERGSIFKGLFGSRRREEEPRSGTAERGAARGVELDRSAGLPGIDDLGELGLDADAIALEPDELMDPELLDFLAADVAPVQADPEFKERLREQLWAMVIKDDITKTKPH